MFTNNLVFDYFLGDESEQFSFVRVPKIFFTDKCFDVLSYGAKIIYGLLLDRMSLSKKNNWRDEQGRTYVIYTIESIQEDFNVSKTKAVNFMKELETFGLIEKKKRPNAPAMIYVKNFISQKEKKEEEKQENSGSPENGLPEVQNMEVQKMESRKKQEISGSPKTGLPKIKLPEVQKMESNKTNIINKTDNIISSSSINDIKRQYMMKMIKDIIRYEQIEKDINDSQEQHLAEQIIDSLVNILLSQKQKCNIDDYDIPMEQVQVKILANLTEKNFRQVLANIQANGSRTIHNLQNYVLVCFWKLLCVSGEKGKTKLPSSFSCLEQHSYDFEELEKELLASGKT